MYPELPFTLPFGITIKTYGFFVMIGFLTGTWFAMKRAERVKANPDLILDAAFFALVFGMLGARLFYVIHYWKPEFAGSANPLLAAIDIRRGGLEFLGGVIGATVALLGMLWWRRASVRLYFDILAPSLMWGLALGRIGCFFNGCCFGGACLAPQASVTPEPAYPWAIRFPFGSPPHLKQWQERQVTVPAELIITGGIAQDFTQPQLLAADALRLSVEQREQPVRAFEQAQRAYDEAKSAGESAERLRELQEARDQAQQALVEYNAQHHLLGLALAQRYPSRGHPDRGTSVSELEDLAAQCKSLPVHPTQLYSSVNALLLFLLLNALFYVRRRHGLVFGMMLLLYPVSRAVLETIRVDNPHDSVGLTISQFFSLLLFVSAVVYLAAIYRLPERSPLAVAYVPPPEEAHA